MLSLLLPTKKEPINLSLFDNPAGKLKHIYDYLKIDQIFFEISNPHDYASPQPANYLSVIEMAVPGGSPSYIKSKLTECLEILKIEIADYLQGVTDFENITDCLECGIDLCQKGSKENDRMNRLSFNERIEFYVNTGNDWQGVSFQFIKFDQVAAIDWEEHFDIRKDFYRDMVEVLSKALEWHRRKPEPSTSPYTWDSANAEMEATELLYLLCKKGELIKINKESGGSFAKFRKEFFGLFGLSGKRYDQNVSEILKRKKDKHFIDTLAELMPNTAPVPPEKK